MNLFRNIIFLTGVFLSIQAIAMEEEDKNQASIRGRKFNSAQEEDMHKGQSLSQTPEENIEEEEYCSHWGLSHCVAGIGEYFWRNFLCGFGFDYTRKDRAWVIYKNHKISRTSDCLISQPHDTCCDWCTVNGNGIVNGWCDNPLYGIVCAPFMAAHLLGELPYYIYHSTPNQRPGMRIENALLATLCCPLLCVTCPLFYIYCGSDVCLGDDEGIIIKKDETFDVKDDEKIHYNIDYSCCLNERTLEAYAISDDGYGRKLGKKTLDD